MRVAELLTENQNRKQVVGLKEVDQVIAWANRKITL
jgi:hypothetical protein